MRSDSNYNNHDSDSAKNEGNSISSGNVYKNNSEEINDINDRDRDFYSNGNTAENKGKQNGSKIDDRDKKEVEEGKDKKIEDLGEAVLCGSDEKKIHLQCIIGEIEGHDALPATSKTTKYEHLLPKLAMIEDSNEIKGVLFLINTVGGDVSSGLALAEMIASMSKPTVSLVLGDSHSIGVPLAVATDYSYIAPSATMIIHPVRMNGTIIGAPQTFDYFKLIQDRIVGFISKHSKTQEDRLEKMMMNTGILTKDLGTILVGEQAVKEGLINEVGGIKEALDKLRSMI